MRTKEKIPFICSILYLLLFLIAICIFYPKMQLQNKHTLPKDITYSGFDIVSNNQCKQHLYYSFEKKELRFYLLSSDRFPAKGGEFVRGHFEKSDQSLQDFYNQLATTVDWEVTELEQLAQTSYFVEQKPLTLLQKIALIFATLIALYALYHIVHYEKEKMDSEESTFLFF